MLILKLSFGDKVLLNKDFRNDWSPLVNTRARNFVALQIFPRAYRHKDVVYRGYCWLSDRRNSFVRNLSVLLCSQRNISRKVCVCLWWSRVDPL